MGYYDDLKALMKESQTRHYRSAWEGPFGQFADASLMASIGYEQMFAECVSKGYTIDDIAQVMPEVFGADSKKLSRRSLKLHRYGLSSLRTDLVVAKMRHLERLERSAAMYSSFNASGAIIRKVKK